MIAEEIEFQISQYVDGTLSAAQRQAVDEILHRDPQAKKVLADYQQLNLHLSKLNAGPSVHWDRLSEHLSAGIDRATGPVIAGRIGRLSPRWSAWSARLRIAAAVLVACTAWVIVRHRSFHPVAPAHVPVPMVDVSGPQPEVANGPSVQDVQVGPSEYALRSGATRYGESVIDHGPSKVVISSLPPQAKHDPHLH